METIRSKRFWTLLSAFAVLGFAAIMMNAPPAEGRRASGNASLAPQADPPAPCPFRDVRRPADINCGPDLGGTGHEAVNFTGSTGSAGDTWLTVYDDTPDNPDQVLFTGNVSLSADVLIHPFNNRKGAGLLALFNEGAGQKGLALIPYDNGNTDSLLLAVVDTGSGKLKSLQSVRMCSIPGSICRGGDAGIQENAWYRLTMDVVVAGDAFTVTGKVFRHTAPNDPNSALGTEVFQVPGPISFNGSLTAEGLDSGGSGEVGIAASAISAVVDSSVTNFGASTTCAVFPAALTAGGQGADLIDPNTLTIAVPIHNNAMSAAENVQVTSITLPTGALTSPALPFDLGTIPGGSSADLDADFSGGPFTPGGSYPLEIKGTYTMGAVTFCFTIDTDILIPPDSPGSADLGIATVDPNTVDGGGFPPQPPDSDDDVNTSRWTVPTGPFVAGTPTATGTDIMMSPLAPASAPNAPAAIVFNVNKGLGFSAGLSGTAEPSGATGGGVVFVSANKRAAYSTNNGTSFTSLDPTTIFPNDAVGFCCDQIVQYAPSVNRFIWLLQGKSTGGYRLATASPATIMSSGGKAWTYWNLTPQVFGEPAGKKFDYPDMAIGDNQLYMSWDGNGGLQVVRTSLAGIAAGGTISLGFTHPSDSSMAWGAHLMQNTGNEIFWAGHNSNSNMRIFSLQEGSNTYFWRSRGVSTWAKNAPLTSLTPDNMNWINFLMNPTTQNPGGGFPKNAVLGSTRVGNELWFAWSAGTDGNFSKPHVEMVTLDRGNDFNKIRQVQIWNSNYAFAYPALSRNACTGEIGLSLEFGGGGNYENHVVGFWGDFIVYNTTGSNTGSVRFGDYTSIRQAPATEANPGNLFAAFGYGVKTGPVSDVHYVLFGRPPASCNVIP